MSDYLESRSKTLEFQACSKVSAQEAARNGSSVSVLGLMQNHCSEKSRQVKTSGLGEEKLWTGLPR
jgi:hypothetical protein